MTAPHVTQDNVSDVKDVGEQPPQPPSPPVVKKKKKPALPPSPVLHSPVVRCSARRAGCRVPNGMILDRIPVTASPESVAVKHYGWVRYPRGGANAIACPGCARQIEKENRLADEDDDWPVAFGGKRTFEDLRQTGEVDV